MMSLFNQMLALPASQEPRTISSSQLCQNTALRPKRTQTRLEQQTPSAHSSSQNLQLLPQLSQGRRNSCQAGLAEEQYWWAEQHQQHLPGETGL